MESFPIIRLEIQEMKHAILHHFSVHQMNVSNAVAEQIEKVIAAYDYEGAVVKAATEVLDGAIESFFKFGAGREMIRDSLNVALTKAFKTEPAGELDP